MKREIETISEIKHNNFKQILNRLYNPIYKLNNMFLKSKEKVSYYYENLNTGTILSFNPNKTFYSASTIKILVCIYLYEQSIKNKAILNEEIEYNIDFQKHDSHIMETKSLGSQHKIKDLIEYTITVSDNSAYIMLMNYVGKETIREYGISLGATTTMEGHDYFGIVNATDYVIYLKKLLNLINEYQPAEIILEHMKNTEVNKINPDSVGGNIIARKGGEWDIAYHDCAIVYDKEPFILCIFTQKGNLKNKDKFINKAAKKIYSIHTEIK